MNNEGGRRAVWCVGAFELSGGAVRGTFCQCEEAGCQ